MSDPAPLPQPAPPPQPQAATPRPQAPSLEAFLGGPPLWVAARLLMLSLIVGIVLSVLGLDPFNIVDSVVRFVRWVAFRIEDILHLGWDTVEWLVRYVLLGAAIVIPIWLVMRLVRNGAR